MRRFIARPALGIIGLAVVLASCGDDGAPASTTTVPAETTTSTGAATTTTTVPTTTSTSTTLPGGPPLAAQGDRNEIVEAFQFLLGCNGFGDLTVDGVFGPLTLAAVEAAQRSLGREVNGAPDEEILADLSRSCSERRRLEGEGTVTVVGNAAPDDPEAFSAALLSDSTVTVTFIQGTGLAVTVLGADGAEVTPQDQSTWRIDTTQDYSIEVASPTGPTTFAIAVEVATGVPETGDWILATDGLSYRGTKLVLGNDAQTVIDRVFDFLGHGVRGAYDEFDTGWYAVTDPGDMGLRGIFIEGFALLFFGPDPNNPDRPETFVRHRFVGSTVDAAGNPRPDDYATTAEGITVGDTLADLRAAYGGRVAAGHNSEEFYYRLTESHGVLCFYFDTEDEPSDYSAISEIASECRTG
jgi:peptidoglycan hydrolase-like protein with peptidoglycan-binding domain